jgi:integrase
VLSRDEVRAVLARLHGPPRIMASLVCGAGLRLLECCRLCVKDLDFGRHQLFVRRGKGDKDRVTMLPASLERPLAEHLRRVKQQHERDVAAGAGWVKLSAASSPEI